MFIFFCCCHECFGFPASIDLKVSNKESISLSLAKSESHTCRPEYLTPWNARQPISVQRIHTKHCQISLCEDLLVEKLDELILQSLSVQLLNLMSFSNASSMLKSNRTTFSSVSSSRTKGRQTSLKIPLRLLSSFDGKQEDVDEPLQTVLVHGLHLDIRKSLDWLSCQQKPLKQRGLLASPVILPSGRYYLYIL